MLGEKQSSKELAFGSLVDKKLQDDPKYLPQVERYPIAQYKLAFVMDGLHLIGYADGFDPNRLKPRLKDDKTGKVAWTQEKADETGQLTMYALLVMLTKKIKPERLALAISWLPTEEKGNFTIDFRDNPVVPVIFETKRTTREALEFAVFLKQTHKEMEAYCRTLSTSEVAGDMG